MTSNEYATRPFADELTLRAVFVRLPHASLSLLKTLIFWNTLIVPEESDAVVDLVHRQATLTARGVLKERLLDETDDAVE